ncbi:MAG: SDR family oxidoreductase [Acidimicrobiales bacterium]
MERKLLLLGLLRSHEMYGYQLNEFIDSHLGATVHLKKPTAYRLLNTMVDDGVFGLGNGGANVAAAPVDVADEAAVVAWFGRAVEQFGRVDCLVNNAGIVGPQSRLDGLDAERIRHLFDVNVLGSMLCAREAVRHMSTLHGGAGGSIVNVSSTASYLGSPGEYIDYAATKGAIDTMTLGLAREVATESIRVNAVRPGLIDTEIHASGGDPGRPERLAPVIPMGRVGAPAEVAQTILWLASDGASYVTGALVNCSGGR